MSDRPSPPPSGESPAFSPRPASDALISLSQAILAPLDALAKAQVHAARSFLNFLLQIGFPKAPSDADGNVDAANAQPSWSVDFPYDAPDGTRHVVTIPTLALVPVQALSIDSAEYSVELVVRQVAPHQQERGTDARKRPWYLVEDPISVRGNLTDSGGDGNAAKQASIKVAVKVARAPTPAGLSKLITGLAQQADVSPLSPNPNSPQQKPGE